ncbi:hypothetical protein [Halorubellus sp. PRR65]|uniref:hypothetical protein n=1 Tax=Halorubellus sp. PRR65 TaxID=3098148 RepID=UPI002B25D6AE|nr:hypothetical protein [Halorubellus sp. PRR65]
MPNSTAENELATRGDSGPNYQITLSVSNRSTSEKLTTVLVHEYTHATNVQRPDFESVLKLDGAQKRVEAAVSEGSATYVAQEYADRYGDAWPNQERFCESYDDGSAAARLWLGQYCVGARYVDDRIDDPANLATVYRNPPNTTEQVRHGYLPDEEPPMSMPVNATTTDSWDVVERHRQGELWTYAVLSTHLADARADAAATGWGNDTRLTYRNFDRDGYVWVTRWDSPDDADEFETAMTAHVENATDGATTNANFRVVRVDPVSVVVLVGDEGFVDGATATATDDGVVVHPPNATHFSASANPVA